MGEATPVVVSVPVSVPPQLPPKMPVVIAPVKATLYVGDLNPAVTEEDLVRVFGCFGAVLSARVCRDRISGKSLRYAYVNFASNLSAESALRAMNHVNLKEKPIRIMWAERNPIGRKNGVGNLFVKNLDESIDGAKLEDLFKPFGRVDSCKVAMDEKGRNRGFGFVQMNTEEAALSAIAALHGTVPNGTTKKLYVAKFVRKCERPAPVTQAGGCSNLYIKNLEKDFTDEYLEEKFSEFGKVNSAVVMKDENGNSRGFGFVSFESPEHANKAMEAMNGSKLGSKTLYVGFAQKKAERADILQKHFCDERGQHLKQTVGTTVFVKNLNECITEKTLQEHFATCGKIISLKVCRNNSGQSKGFGFVNFSTLEEANKAVSNLNGTEFGGKTIYLTIAQPRQKLFKTLQNQQSSASSYPLVYHQTYCSAPSHNLSPAYHPARIGFSNHALQSFPGPATYYQQQQVQNTPLLNPAFNSEMHPMMPYPLHGTYHTQNERYVNNHSQNQSCVPPQRIEKGVKKEQNPMLHLPSVQPTLSSNFGALDKSKMEEILYTCEPKLEPKHASKIADLMLQMNGTKLHDIMPKPRVSTQRMKDVSKGC